MKKLRSLRIGWFTKIVAFGYAKGGVPDILGCIRGKFVAIELKSPEVKDPIKALDPTQALIIAIIRHHGGPVLVSNNLQEIVNFVTQIYNDP